MRGSSDSTQGVKKETARGYEVKQASGGHRKEKECEAVERR